MKHREDLEELFRFLAITGILTSEKQRKQISYYLELLENWSSKQNLVSNNDKHHLIKRHFVPSLFLHACLPKIIGGRILDLGSGAGFLGVLIKIMRPDIQITLLDSSKKKILFLQEVCERLGLDAHIVCRRCEDYWDEGSQQYQFVVARAVARIQILLKLVFPLLITGGQLWLLKGIDYEKEIAEVEEIKQRHMVYKPAVEWLKYVNYLENKCVISVEK